MQINLKDMLKAGIHFGHRTSRWCPKMRPFIWGSRNHVHLIDVSKTAFLLERAGKVLTELAGNGGSFLFVGTKKPAQNIIKKMAIDLKMPYLINRWIGGTLTNFDQVKKAIVRYLHLCDVVKRPTTHFKKKEIAMIQKEIGRLEKNIGGIVDLNYPPAAVIIVDANREASAVKEATNLGIPVFALVDTNTNPEGINFIIPSNDDSPRAISYIMEYLQASIQKGIELAAENKAKKEAEAKNKKSGGDTEAQKAVDAADSKPVEKKAAPKKAAPKPAPRKPAPRKAAPKEATKEVAQETTKAAPQETAKKD
jgi:small subunit ribosomal protein S2